MAEGGFFGVRRLGREDWRRVGLREVLVDGFEGGEGRSGLVGVGGTGIGRCPICAHCRRMCSAWLDTIGLLGKGVRV